MALQRQLLQLVHLWVNMAVNIMEFCKQFNAQTASRKGETVPVVITVYTDKTFTFVVKTPPTTELIKKEN